jgi:7,8-dihydropterin-6-yl-methyl-4-(beta-D-ribofuranosyl)aminobenzene 5'-phosphate synthase
MRERLPRKPGRVNLAATMRFLGLLVLLAVAPGLATAAEDSVPSARVHALRITVLSTMLADGLDQYGEWGWGAFVEVDGHRILFDTGAHTDVVLRNARALGVDLSTVPEVVLSHNHADHTGGLLTIRREMMARSSSAISVVHVGEGIFYPRTTFNRGIEDNPVLLMKPEFEKTGGVFVSHDKPAELYPGVWLTGPVPRKYPEHNWSGSGRVKTPAGWVEDNIPEDQALVFDTDKGIVVLVGCGHAGIINTLDYVRSFLRPSPIHAVIGGVHLFAASDETLDWTAAKLGEFGLQNFLGGHCTGIEPVIRFRAALRLGREHCAVAAVGSTFDLVRGMDPGVVSR